MRGLFNKIKLPLAGMLLAVGALLAVNGFVAEADAQDCTANAVIRCGVTGMNDLRDKYARDYTKGTQNIFSHFGLTKDVINNYTYQRGTVYKNGDVYVGSKKVATGAHSAGRQYLPGSTKHTVNGTSFYTRPLSVSTPPSWDVYVFTDKNGRFVGAVMLVCGNPVMAKPVEPPKPKPVYACVSVSRIKQSDPNKYVFRAKSAAENGAKPTGFTVEFGDGKSSRVGVQRTEGKYAFADVPYTYTQSGTYTVKLTAHFNVNGKTVSHTAADCKKSVDIPKKPTPPAPKPKNPGVSIDKTVRAHEMRHIDDSKKSSDDDLERSRTEASLTNTRTVGDWREHARVDVNQPFEYRLIVRNTGDVALKNAVVTDTAPAGVEFLSADKGQTTAGSWSYMIPELAVNQSTTIVIQAKVTQHVENRITNTACVDAKEVPGDRDDCDDATVEVEKPKQPPVVTKTIEVCVLETKQYPVTKNEDEFDSSLHSLNPADCEEVVEEVPVEKPAEVPTELPQTGLVGAVNGILGFGTLTAASYYYLVSRRNS